REYIQDTFNWTINDDGQIENCEPTSVTNSDLLPIKYTLKQNYPNPFNPTTQIRFSVPEQTHVHLEVYNLLGQRVTTLVNEQKSAGWYDVNFDATNLTSGLYIYRLQTDAHVETRQMMLIK
ncbi:MAG: T9SS type A sorting domain-containing protein, partial [Balneolales bacterium]